MLAFTIDPVNNFKIEPGITTKEYKVNDKTFIGVDVGYFNKHADDDKEPALRIFRIKYIKAGATVHNIEVKTRPSLKEPSIIQLFAGEASQNDAGIAEALVYITATDPESRVRVINSKELFPQGKIFEGSIAGTVEHQTRDGKTFVNKCRPAVLVMEANKTYKIQYDAGTGTRIGTIAFDGKEVVLKIDEPKNKSFRPKSVAHHKHNTGISEAFANAGISAKDFPKK